MIKNLLLNTPLIITPVIFFQNACSLITPPSQLFIFYNKKSNNKILTTLISTSGGRFPWARLQSPRHFVPAGLLARAVPTGVATLRSNQ